MAGPAADESHCRGPLTRTEGGGVTVTPAPASGLTVAADSPPARARHREAAGACHGPAGGRADSDSESRTEAQVRRLTFTVSVTGVWC